MKTDTDGLTMNQLAERNAEHVATISALEARCAALAAENAGLKAFGNKLDEMHNELNGEGTGIQGRAEVACQQVALEAAMEEFDAIKTPATDAFLAEVRASAIEAFADNQEKIADEELVGGNLDLSLRFRGMARAAKEFAAQIRQDSAQ